MDSRKTAEKSHGQSLQKRGKRGTQASTGHDATVAAGAIDRLTRASVAKRLKVSISTVRRLEGEVLHPQFIDGQNVFDHVEVDALALQRPETIGGMTNGAVAAKVFSLLDDGVHPIEIVKQTELGPELVETLYDRWARWKERIGVGQYLQVPVAEVRRIVDSSRDIASSVAWCNVETAHDLLRWLGLLATHVCDEH